MNAASSTVLLAAGLLISWPSPACEISPLRASRSPSNAEAVSQVLGTVLSTRSHRSPPAGPILTTALVRSDRVLAGSVPESFELTWQGGHFDGMAQTDSADPGLAAGDVRMFRIVPRREGRGYALRGGRSGALRWPDAQGSPTPLPGPVPGASSNARFVAGDRGEPIPCLVDLDYLPQGISREQALAALKQATDAWSAVTSLRFSIVGIQSFGKAANQFPTANGLLRIQMHDHYGAVTGGLELGRGGLGWTTQLLNSGWTTGGNVKGTDFHFASGGFVILQHNQEAMRNLTTYTEVLTHEIGHAIGLDHSSESSNETDPVLREAIMFYLVHEDGRGASLNSHDIAASQRANPRDSTPPYTEGRVLDVVSSPDPPQHPEVNSAQLRGYDLQGQTLTLETSDATENNGEFSRTGSTVSFTPRAYFSQSERLDPAENRFYDVIYARFTDGQNASPFVSVRVVSFNPDAASEGIPDEWRQQYFGSSSPSAGPNRRATDDFDQDGYNNLQEFRLGSNPADRNSNLRLAITRAGVISWAAKPYEVYEVRRADALAPWSGSTLPVVPAASPAVFTAPADSGTSFYRVEKVP